MYTYIYIYTHIYKYIYFMCKRSESTAHGTRDYLKEKWQVGRSY